MAIRSFTIINADGEVVLHRNFVGCLSPAQLQVLKLYVLKADFQQPLIHQNNLCILHKGLGTLHFFCNCSAQGDAMAGQVFMGRFIEVMKYFIPSFLDYKTVKGQMAHVMENETTMILKNQVVLQEMLEEMIDNGDIVTTDPEVLKLFIDYSDNKGKKQTQEQKELVTIQATKQLNHRRDGIVYSKNDVKLKVYENLICSVDNTGRVLEAISEGEIQMMNHLSGMPDCSITLNDRITQQQFSGERGKPVSNAKSQIVLDDIQFHHCVKLDQFQTKKIITFIPPDGSFQLVRFRITQSVANPFNIHVMINQVTKHTISATVSIKSTYQPNIKAERLQLFVPAPPNTAECKCHCSHGKARLDKTGEFLEWRLNGLAGLCDGQLKFEFTTGTTTNTGNDLTQWKRPFIRAAFDIRNYTASGIQVCNLQVVERSAYQVTKRLKAMTSAKAYSIKW